MSSPSFASGTVTYRNDISLLLASRVAAVNGYVASRVLPFVPVNACSDFYYKVDAGPMMEAPNNNRARGGAYPEIVISTRQSTYSCNSRGLAAKIPVEDVKEHNRLALQEMGSWIATLQMLNSHEKRVADLVINRTTWPVATGTGHNCADEWDDHANAKPVDDILTAKAAVAGNVGALASTGLCAVMSWYTAHHLMLCDQLRDKLGFKYKDAEPADAVWMEQVLARALGLSEVIIGGMQYKSAGTDAAPTGTNFWDDEYCMVFRRAEFTGGRSQDNEMPSVEPVVTGLGCVFQWNEMGDLFEVYDYFDPTTNSNRTKIDQYTDEQVLLSGAGYLIGNCKS